MPALLRHPAAAAAAAATAAATAATTTAHVPVRAVCGGRRLRIRRGSGAFRGLLLGRRLRRRERPASDSPPVPLLQFQERHVRGGRRSASATPTATPTTTATAATGPRRWRGLGMLLLLLLRAAEDAPAVPRGEPVGARRRHGQQPDGQSPSPPGRPGRQRGRGRGGSRSGDDHHGSFPTHPARLAPLVLSNTKRDRGQAPPHNVTSL